MEEDFSLLWKVLRSLDLAQLNIWKQEKNICFEKAPGPFNISYQSSNLDKSKFGLILAVSNNHQTMKMTLKIPKKTQS